MNPSRRAFAGGVAALGAVYAAGPIAAFGKTESRFEISVISDEISQDFDHACSVIANDFGLRWVELREMWGKNLQGISAAETAEAQKILKKYNLQVTDIASPLFKVDWAGAAPSQYSPKKDMHGAHDVGFAQQDAVLERSLELAKEFKTGRVRCFDFWRLDDIAVHRAAIDRKLQEAATTAGKQGVMLLIENEFSCNTATGREAAATLAGVPSPWFGLNWDPGNAVMRGETDAFPGGWNSLPKHRIHHCHCKNAVAKTGGGYEWSPVDIGLIDWTAQFRALRAMGYREAISLETHWRGAGTPEASTRISWAGMKKRLEEAGVQV